MVLSRLAPSLFRAPSAIAIVSPSQRLLRGLRSTEVIIFLSADRLELCLFVPCFPAFFDLLISLGQQGLIIIRLHNGPPFSKWPKQVGVLVHSTKSLQNLV